MRTTRSVAFFGVAAIATVSACGVNPKNITSSNQPPVDPAALLNDAFATQAAPNVAALGTACDQLTTDLVAAPSSSNPSWQQATYNLTHARDVCLQIVNATPAGERGTTPTSGAASATAMIDLLNSAIGLMKSIADNAGVPSTTSSTSMVPLAPGPGAAGGAGAVTALPYTITVHIDDQPLATGDGRVLAPPTGTVGLSYMTETYQCPDGMVCGANIFHYSGGMVTLTAGWDNTSKFLGWDGAPCTTANVCRFTLTSNLDVTAHFAPATYKLTINNLDPPNGKAVAAGGGVWCGEGYTDCYDVVERSNVPLVLEFSGVLAPPTDYDVVEVSGPGCDLNLQAAPPTTGATCTLTRSQDTKIDVDFSPATHP